MPTLLAVHTSPRFNGSTSRKLTEAFIKDWQVGNPEGQVIRRDLAADPLPYVDLPWIGGAYAPPEQQTPAAKVAIRVSDDLVSELQAADHLVIGTPMYNFSIPAALKAWIDHVVRVGVTVSPDNVGLLTGKKATIILATGGDFGPGSPIEGYNQASGYLRAVLAWIGITDVNIVLANKARAGDHAETAIEQFGQQVSALAMAA